MKLLISCVLRAGASDSATQLSTGLRSTALPPAPPRPAPAVPAALAAESFALVRSNPRRFVVATSSDSVFDEEKGVFGRGGEGGQTRRCPAGPALKRPLTVAPPVPNSCVRMISH